MRPNRSFDADTQRHCAARRMLPRTARGAMPLRAGQLRRWADKDDCTRMSANAEGFNPHYQTSTAQEESDRCWSTST
jgi:hypothetical protein